MLWVMERWGSRLSVESWRLCWQFPTSGKQEWCWGGEGLCWEVLVPSGITSLWKLWAISIGLNNTVLKHWVIHYCSQTAVFLCACPLCSLVGLLVEHVGQPGWRASPVLVMESSGLGLTHSTVTQMSCRWAVQVSSLRALYQGIIFATGVQRVEKKSLLSLPLSPTADGRLWGGRRARLYWLVRVFLQLSNHNSV